MISTNVYGLNGKTTGKISLPEDYFGAKVNPTLMAQAVRVYLANQRSARAKAKTRGEVVRTTAKWFRQKGTGRARHGARSAPIFVGGGVAHGPRGKQNWQETLSTKMRKQALAAALTSKLKKKEIMIIDGWKKLTGKTKEMTRILNSFRDQKAKKRLKFLLVLPKKIETVVRAARNISGLKVRPISLLNAYEVLNGGKILITPEAINTLKKS